MNFAFFYLLCNALAILQRFCQEPEEIEGQLSRSLYQIERMEDWQPIRIKALWETIHESSVYQEFLQKAFNFYESSLKVRRLIHPILANPNYFCLPDKSLLQNQTFEADFVITIKFFNNSEVQYAAMAYPCLSPSESTKSQPITGHMKLNLAYLPEYSSDQLQMILTHELTHALGFTSKLFSSFLNPDSSSPQGSNIFVNKTVRQAARVLFAGESLKQRARLAFSCDSLEGLELENQGGRGAELSHWERRLMFNDFMNPQIVDGPAVYSDLSLAVLADSGWYSVSYDLADPIAWGFHKGCEFIDEKCMSEGVPRFEEFCGPEEKESCTFDLKGLGKCEIWFRDDVEEAYQYFDDNRVGDFFTDFCPVVKGHTFCMSHENQAADPQRGEKICEDCWCVEGNLGKNSSFLENSPGCFQVACLNHGVLLKVGDQAVACFGKGQIVQVEGFFGNLICPDIEKICNGSKNMQNYDKFCNGRECESLAALISAVWVLLIT